ncbi:MAG: SMR family transporter [Alphaproteobacteria bacterium]|nr:SMR family transporter [Alphaproteobacteria bacterium]
MNWIILIVAGMFETVWAVALKNSEGFTKLYPSIIFFVATFLSMYLLSVAMKTIPLGTAYAVWTGIGAITTVIYGILYFNEPVSIYRMVFLLFIFTGIVGLKCK